MSDANRTRLRNVIGLSRVNRFKHGSECMQLERSAITVIGGALKHDPIRGRVNVCRQPFESGFAPIGTSAQIRTSVPRRGVKTQGI
jgi:hypothetical protein